MIQKRKDINGSLEPEGEEFLQGQIRLQEKRARRDFRNEKRRAKKVRLRARGESPYSGGSESELEELMRETDDSSSDPTSESEEEEDHDDGDEENEMEKEVSSKKDVSSAPVDLPPHQPAAPVHSMTEDVD